MRQHLDRRSAPGSGSDRLPIRHIVVIGFGMAGARLVDDLLLRDPDRRLRITVIGAEPYGAYNRILLSDVVAGRADVAGLALTDSAELQAAGVEVLLGRQVSAIDRQTRDVVLADGDRVAYDRLVLATGATPFVPPIPGMHGHNDQHGLLAGVHTLRTVDDCREIVAATANARRAVVLGGGLLGLEAARGLARRGLDVTVVHVAHHVMERQLDAAAAAVLTRSLRRGGMDVRTAAQVQRITSENGRLTGLDLPGEHLPADLLVLSCGVRPNVGLAAAAGLPVGAGIVVDDALRTDDPRIHAIGDCAEHRGEVPGLVAPAWEQARVVAAHLTGADPTAAYAGHRPVVRLKAADLDVMTCGETDVDPWDDDPALEVVQLLDPGRGRYVKAVVRSGCVVGAISIGEPRAAAELSLLVDRGSPAPADRAVLLLPGARGVGPAAADDPTLIPDRATVCRCNGVTKGAIVRAWRGGARTVEEVSAATRASTGCGTCRDALEGLVGWLAASDPDPLPGDPNPLPGDPNPLPVQLATPLPGGLR